MNRFLKLFLAISLILALCFNAVGCELLGSFTETPDTSEGTDDENKGDGSSEEDDDSSQSGSGTEDNTPGSGDTSGENGGSSDDGNGDGQNTGTGDGNPNGGNQSGSGTGDQNQNSGTGDSGNVTEDKVTYNDIRVDAFGGFTVPAYSGTGYYVINNNVPFFTDEEIVTTSYERYGALDSLGRVTTAMSCIGKDLMPTEARGDISSVKPTGWVQANYSVIKGGYLYNRCHMIGWQLTAENANRQNLITGTRFMNETMIPFENQIADYIKETNNHVMYRITPVFAGNNLLAYGLILEAYSVEDEGDGISFSLFIYNVQDKVHIDYATGNSRMVGENNSGAPAVKCDYVLNTNSKKIHDPDCSSAAKISDKNKQEYNGYIEDLLNDGYTKCANCNPE